MRNNFLILIGIFLVLSGCATFSPPWKDYFFNEYKSEPIRSYELDREYKVSVGDVIVSAFKGTMEKFYEPLFKDTIIWRGRTISHFDNGSENGKWIPKYIYDGGDGDYILTSENFHNGVIGIIVKDNGSIPDSPILRLDKKGSVERFPIMNAPESGLLFRKVVQLKDSKGNFKFELLYTGKENNIINIVYREYVNDLARNSFYQNLTYDLSESNIIKFKSIEIEILNSSNSELSFKIINDGNLKWVP